MFKHIYKYCFLILGFIFILQGCSSTASYKIQSFFFDGVTSPAEKDAIVAILRDSLTIKGDISLVQQNNVDMPILIHPPYKERACKKCHNKDAMGKPRLELPELCYTCHTKMEDKYAVLHAPVGFGSCTQCHSPHIAKLDKLLLAEGQDLCYKCHNEADIKANTIHKTIEEQACTNCHNPHGGENKMVLQKDACFKCHDNFAEKYKFVHGPVGAGKCASCHQTHSSKVKKLLVREGDNLCLNCHNKQDIASAEYHKKISATTCINCHNPHGSNQKYLLVKATN